MMAKRVWFEKAISFACTGCGKCCKSRNTRVFVNSAEVASIAHHLQVEATDVEQAYTNKITDASGHSLMTLKSNPANSQCVFLKNNACTVYAARPTQCRTYPFWPQIVVGEAEWKAEGNNCEGIGISNALETYVEVDAVGKEMIIHEMHSRGAGENWTYDTAMELLEETVTNELDTIPEYIGSFFAGNESRIVYESAVLRVVDGKCVKEEPVGEMDSDPASTEVVEYSRRMEFVGAPLLAQTEVRLTGRPADWPPLEAQTDGGLLNAPGAELDHSCLFMPVHRTMAALAVQFLTTCSTGSSEPTVAILGAGCCALSSHLLQGEQHRLSRLSIHAVEPCAEVLQVAQKYFGATFESSTAAHPHCVIPHILTGEDFLEKHASLRFDVVVIDAFASRDGANDSSDVCAPPAALLDHLPLLHRSLDCGVLGGGLLVMNVYGTTTWIESVCAKVRSSGLFSEPMLVEVASGASGPVVVKDAPGVSTRNVVLTARRNS